MTEPIYDLDIDDGLMPNAAPTFESMNLEEPTP